MSNLSLESGEISLMLAVRRTDFNEKDHATDGAVSAKLNLFELCRVATEDGKTNNLEEVRSLVHEQNYASASERNFVIDKTLSNVEVRLRHTFYLIWLDGQEIMRMHPCISGNAYALGFLHHDASSNLLQLAKIVIRLDYT